MSLELTTCPECGARAEVIKRFVLSSTDGPVEHVKTRCVTGPWLTYPATAIDAAPVEARDPSSPRAPRQPPATRRTNLSLGRAVTDPRRAAGAGPRRPGIHG
jgi:hypothetical protein